MLVLMHGTCRQTAVDPITWRDVLDADRYGFLGAARTGYDGFGNRPGQFRLLLLGSAGIEFYDDVGHGSYFLACRPEQDFVDVHLVGLAHGKGNRPRERVRRDRRSRVEFPNSVRSLRVAHTVGQLRRYGAR
jgi:hypothetical protein